MSDSDQQLENQKLAPAGPSGAPLPDAPDDAGSQALSEALRSGFAIIQFVMVGLVLLFVFSGFFTVGTQETAVILRLGRPVGTGDKVLLGPGAHWAFPAPIDEVVRIPVSQLQTVVSTIGWYATSAAKRHPAWKSPPVPPST